MILRCAMDRDLGIFEACQWLDEPTWMSAPPALARAFNLAKVAREHAQSVRWRGAYMAYRDQCLEAAQLLDEGWSP